MIIDIMLCMEYLGMNEEYWQQAQKALDTIKNDDTARTVAKNAKRLLCTEKNVSEAELLCKNLTQYARAFLPQHADMALAALLGACLPAALQQLSLQGVPDDVIKDTFRDFSRWAETYQQQYGVAGIGELPWVLFPYAQRILKLGRLMYETVFFPYPYYIYKKNGNGEIIILAAEGIRVTAQGLVEHTNSKPDAAVFTTSLTLENGWLTGNRVDINDAVILPQQHTIRLAEHRILLSPGMPILNMHIPQEGPLTPDAVNRSMEQAIEFYKKCGFPCETAMCESWLLDPSLLQFSSKNSNSVQFMKRFAKFPVCVPQPSAAKRIFGFDFDMKQLQHAPEETGMQKALKTYLLQGGEIFDVGGICLLK